MMDAVLKQFLTEEAVPAVRKIILDAVKDHGSRPSECQRQFEFNRFDVRLDFVARDVVIEDVLDPSEAGETRLKLDEFLSLLTSG